MNIEDLNSPLGINLAQLKNTEERGRLLAERHTFLKVETANQTEVAIQTEGLATPIVEQKEITIQKKGINPLNKNGYSYQQISEFIMETLELHHSLAEDELETILFDKYAYDVKQFRNTMNTLRREGHIDVNSYNDENNKRHYSLI